MTRLKPGELLVSLRSKKMVIPLLTPEVISVLKRIGSFAEAKTLVEKQAVFGLPAGRAEGQPERTALSLKPPGSPPSPRGRGT